MQYITIYVMLPKPNNQYCVLGITYNNFMLHIWENENNMNEARPTAGFQDVGEHFSLSKFLL